MNLFCIGVLKNATILKYILNHILPIRNMDQTKTFLQNQVEFISDLVKLAVEYNPKNKIKNIIKILALLFAVQVHFVCFYFFNISENKYNKISLK